MGEVEGTAVTEEEWLVCRDPTQLLGILCDGATDQKCLRFCEACGDASDETLRNQPWNYVVGWVYETDSGLTLERKCGLLRDIFGNPFRPVTLDPRWLTSSVLDLGRAIYDERAIERMPILADALMDAGCDNEEVLNHCRGDGPHVRGCWVVDLILGKT
jgi:hypothetical protein